MHVSAILKGPLDQIGRRKVYICMITDGKRTFRATNIKVDPKDWKGGKANDRSINDRIKSLILSYESGYVKPEQTFYKFAMNKISDWEHSKSPNTIKDLTARVKKFRSFFDGLLSSVTPQVLNNYVTWLHKSYKGNTVWSHLKAIRLLLNQAYREGLINDNPLRNFDMPKYRDPQKVFLSKDDLSKIVNLVSNNCPKEYRIAGAWFLISCYTGLRYSDQVSFNKSKIKSGRLVIYTSKTGTPVSIKLNDKLKELFELVDYKPLPYTNQYYNRVLKAIRAECKIEEEFSAHTARHTAATLLASAGVSIEVASRVLGHRSIRTTAIYYQLTGDVIDKEFEKIF